MKTLDSLVRLRRHAVEEKQKILADLLRQVEPLEEQKKAFYARLKQERDAIKSMERLETADYYGLFEGTIRKDIERLDHDIRALDTRISLAQEEVRQAFADMKRVEIVKERRDDEAAQEIKKKESSALDAIGIDIFSRRE